MTMLPRLPGLRRPLTGDPRSRAPWTARRKVVVTVTAVVVAAAASYGGWSLKTYLDNVAATCANDGPTVVTHESANDPECVGITDGSYKFVPGDRLMADVESAIETEDAWVLRQHRAYATVAYLLPISPSGGGVFPATTAAEQLAGVYAAQHWANRNNVEGENPLIQVLIASAGTQAAGWKTAAQDIENDVGSRRLVAVGGIAVSLKTTIAEVNALATNPNQPIPVFAGTLTSDAFDNIQNMVRVTPSNAQEVSAALAFIKPKAATAFLVQDINQSDSYNTTIDQEFRSGFPDKTHRLDAIESYDTTGETSPQDPVAEAAANRIGQMPSDICDAGASVVLFAGRARDLATLIGDLAHRPCLGLPITILTGDDAINLPITSAVGEGLKSNVTLDFAGAASPREWSDPAASSVGPGTFSAGQRGFAQFRSAFTSAAATGVTDDDGNAMLGYDDLLTAISAIRLAGIQPSPGGVATELSALQRSRTVDGASGPISFSADYHNPARQGSNPVGKVIPILRLQPDGALTFVHLEP